ncbi:MAG: bifunctional diguanylate cyclase/phosphodiesterase [Methylophilaceae bacterium]|nr:bifunctional diguanylate cyclase/phosphodiesterase [Methylophilaceae bacterium]
MSKIPSSRLEQTRLRVVDRMAALLESQTRTKLFGSNVHALVQAVHDEIMARLRDIAARENSTELARSLEDALQTCRRLDACLGLLLEERTRQWYRNGDYVQETLREFNQTLAELASTLIEKDLFERQSQVLGHIILSHEHISQWKEFVQEILTRFHAIFPFQLFFIAFAEEHSLSLYIYFLGKHTRQVRELARHELSQQMLKNLGLPVDAPVDIEEFVIPQAGPVASAQEMAMITVAVPKHTPNLSGMLGVAYASSQALTPQEESVIRAILSVMVMVVGSSKALSRTMAELEYYSIHDPLTGLYNRRHFEAMLKYEIGRSERHHHEFSILLLDLDDFKDINDTYGHATGDKALCHVANIMQAHTRKGDLATRIGGDEFAIILMETGKKGAMTVAGSLGKTLRETPLVSPEGKYFHLTVSIGIVTYPADGQNETDLMAGVDLAMYRAKEMGKDGACTLDAVGGGERVHATRSTRDYAEQLREALRQNRMIPYFQPIIHCRSGEIFAYETLARFRQDNGETVSAGMFIEAIEKYGLGRELDRAVISQAFAARKAHMAQDATSKLFINLSSQEIQGRNILGYAEELCERLELPHHLIVFEILERDAIGDMSNMRRFLNSLRQKGFAFALDDFGSGYNSFHYLRELRFEFVKIDGAFVRNILESKIDRALVHNLSRLCQDIGIQTVAEFVENQAILDALQEMGIDYAQGYHIALPGSSF